MGEGVMGMKVVLSLLAAFTMAAEPTRVFITDSDAWEFYLFAGGSKPQKVEIIKTFTKKKECRGLTITADPARAHFVITLDRLGGAGLVRRDNKVAVFNADKDLVYAGATRSLGNAVKDACNAIQRVR
jgi:hypothetical protein